MRRDAGLRTEVAERCHATWRDCTGSEGTPIVISALPQDSFPAEWPLLTDVAEPSEA